MKPATLDARRVAGLDPTSGSVVWEIPLDANRSSQMAHPGGARIHGCRLVFQIADDVMRLADGFDSSRLRVVDVVSGAIVSRPTCLSTPLSTLTVTHHPAH